MCVTSAMIMSHTCRESCGVCGFLSSYNNEEQLVGDISYSDYKSDKFKCGDYKLLCEINNESCEGKRWRVPEEEEVEEEEEEEEINQNVVDDEDHFADYNAEEKDQYYCGATIVSDR